MAHLGGSIRRCYHPIELYKLAGLGHEDLLFVEDVRLVRQRCTWASVRFDDAAVADFFDGEVDTGRQPEEFGRLWLHTHPGRSAQPSGIDESTFWRCFGNADWSVMVRLM